MREVTFTADERALLRTVGIGPCIASPAAWIEHMRLGERSGGGRGFSFRFTKSALVGTWHEWIPNRWREDGEPMQWHPGELLREASVSYRRLQRWCEALSAEVIAEAVRHWRKYPQDTRDLPALAELAREQLASPTPTPEPEQLNLLEMTNV